MSLKQGNPGKRNRKALEAAAAVTADAAPSSTVPDPPAPLDDDGLVYWCALYVYLDRRQQIKKGDCWALCRLCELYDTYYTFRRACKNRRGKFIPFYKTKTTTGAIKHATRPEWTEARALLPAILVLEREFGLTPSSRATVVGKLAEARDPERPVATPGNARAGSPAQPAAPPLVVGTLAPPRSMN